MKTKIAFLFLACAILVTSCKKQPTTETTNTTGATGSTTVAVPAIYTKIYGATSISNDGTIITIKCTGSPDHKSVYYPTTDANYEPFSGTTFGGYTFARNPNSISSVTYTFKIPVNPQLNSAHAATPLGPIGVALNGVPLYNQYAGPNQPLTGEIASFDKYYGHPAPGGRYHYHVEPLYITTVKATKSSLVGFLLDGFPVYGPEENGAAVTNAMLDVYHGHIGVTADYSGAIYHYHITNLDPYINGSGFYGTAGTVSQ